ncbi:MAG TPA: transketolase [Polyangiaceae bacterium]|nr:transketolase [Polyangiaceae bacterium]
MSEAFQPATLARAALGIRRQFLRMHFQARSGHLGSGLSAIDILTYLYSAWLKPKDQFILSKGHAASSLYATLHHFGRLSEAELASYYQDGTLLPAHPAPRGVAAIVAATGSLGHGLSIATGMAHSYKYLRPTAARVACLVSDGECNAGSTWEAALFAAHHGLDNLLVLVDANGIQGFGRSADVLGLEPLAEKWRAFGFDVRECDGHDFGALHGAVCALRSERPGCVIARTVKGKGVSFMEDTIDWHYWSMSEEQYRNAIAELDRAESELSR